MERLWRKWYQNYLLVQRMEHRKRCLENAWSSWDQKDSETPHSKELSVTVRIWNCGAHRGSHAATHCEHVLISECGLRKPRYKDQVLLESETRGQVTNEETTTVIQEKWRSLTWKIVDSCFKDIYKLKASSHCQLNTELKGTISWLKGFCR